MLEVDHAVESVTVEDASPITEPLEDGRLGDVSLSSGLDESIAVE